MANFFSHSPVIFRAVGNNKIVRVGSGVENAPVLCFSPNAVF